jgi:hypothetical protein
MPVCANADPFELVLPDPGLYNPVPSPLAKLVESELRLFK